MDEDEEGESKMMMFASVSDIWIKTPPITQMYLLGSLVLTVLSFGLNKNRWPQLLHFDWKAILTGQVWRIYTAFLFFGPLDIFYPMTMQFVWQHMSQLEKMNYNKPEDFVILLLFGAVTLISIYSIMGISMKFLGHNLATYLVYIWARVFEGMDVNFMDLVTLKSEMIPWFFCAQTWLLEHEIPFADIIGILVGHIYHYLKEKKKLDEESEKRETEDGEIYDEEKEKEKEKLKKEKEKLAQEKLEEKARRAKFFMEGADVDGDGAMSLQEAIGAGFSKEQFKEMDGNGDGQVRRLIKSRPTNIDAVRLCL
jgi:Derlin-2/3